MTLDGRYEQTFMSMIQQYWIRRADQMELYEILQYLPQLVQALRYGPRNGAVLYHLPSTFCGL